MLIFVHPFIDCWKTFIATTNFYPPPKMSHPASSFQEIENKVVKKLMEKYRRHGAPSGNAPQQLQIVCDETKETEVPVFVPRCFQQQQQRTDACRSVDSVARLNAGKVSILAKISGVA